MDKLVGEVFELAARMLLAVEEYQRVVELPNATPKELDKAWELCVLREQLLVDLLYRHGCRGKESE